MGFDADNNESARGQKDCEAWLAERGALAAEAGLDDFRQGDGIGPEEWHAPLSCFTTGQSAFGLDDIECATGTCVARLCLGHYCEKFTESVEVYPQISLERFRQHGY